MPNEVNVEFQTIIINGGSSQFNDPVASRTAWTPLKMGGTTFRTHRLVQTGAERMEFRATRGAITFYAGLFLAPLLFIGFFIAVFPFDRLPAGASSMVPSLLLKFLLGFGVYAAIIGYFFHMNILPVVFDGSRGLFWKGWREPGRRGRSGGSRRCVALDDIHALQLISGYVGRRRGFYSYEVNLVLTDGSRINLIDHGSREGAVEDAQALSRFLRRPLWNATGEVPRVSVFNGAW